MEKLQTAITQTGRKTAVFRKYIHFSFYRRLLYNKDHTIKAGGTSMDYKERYNEWLSNPYFDADTKAELASIRDQMRMR